MKKILKKVGSGLSKLRNTKAKIIITAILTVIMLVDVNPFFLKAGRETLVYTFKDGIQHPYAFDKLAYPKLSNLIKCYYKLNFLLQFQLRN